MSIVKQEQYEQEAAIFAYRTEAGVQVIRDRLIARREDANRKWVTSVDATEVARLQGEVGLVNYLLNAIDVGPRIKGDA